MSNHYTFIGGNDGQWSVTSSESIKGPALETVKTIKVINAPFSQVQDQGNWMLRGFTSNLRYAEKDEVNQLKLIQEGLGRSASVCGALIALKKNAEWWSLCQDERRAIFEEQSHHTKIGMAYLPEIARQLHHSRDLGEPFDFITWFEYSPENTNRFDDLLAELRETREWQYIEREMDIRLEKNAN